ncbi:CidA/LrgA family protein [[Clostridium] fimetarium]|uniref:Holin-like protein n=1 Tax=[Clostridium] fimetarium TaxID=99656 RepID=A0A1I0QKG9_9FIRM|nr:CidA/LrgA family protein [[Clostridium] fimetarium]SEW27760.1 holin-like protein [[Clostridium] fimetarium]
MRSTKQFGLILAVTFIGEILRFLIPLPIPASIYGLVIMLIVLKTGIVKLEQVKNAAGFLIEIMPLMFIPAAVGILVSWDALKDIYIPIIFITITTTIIVMVVTGRITQFIIRIEKRK